MIKRGTWAAAVACAALFAVGRVRRRATAAAAAERRRRRQGRRRFKVPKVPMAQSVGAGEGKLNIIAWAGYAEDGSTDPKVDWVTPFEKQTGCQVNVKIGNTSDEMVTLMRTGQYDGVSASGDATLRLIAGGDVAPVNTDLVPNYADVFAQLKDQDLNSVNGQMYGIPHGRGANLLMWRSDKVTTPPDSWSAVFDQGSQYKGKVTAYDNPIYIADAALYLKATKPDLKITNPYELDDKQFQAAVDLLKKQRQNIGEYWSDYTKEQAAFTSGDSTVGTTWQVIANLLDADKVKVKTTLPKEGATGWSDTWMIASKAKHPNCMYKWMDWIISPKVNAAGGGVVRRGAVEREVVRGDRGQEPLQDLPRRRRGLLRQGLLLDDAAHAVRRRPRRRCARTTRSGSRPGPRSRDKGPTLQARRRVQLGLLLSGPLGWLAVAYLGSLAVLFVSAFWQLDDFSGEIVKQPTLRQLQAAVGERRLPHDRLPHDRDRRAGDGHRRAARLPDRVLHGQGRQPARARAARGRRSSCRCGPRTS